MLGTGYIFLMCRVVQLSQVQLITAVQHMSIQIKSVQGKSLGCGEVYQEVVRYKGIFEIEFFSMLPQKL